jgi:hypothetical protein
MSKYSPLSSWLAGQGVNLVHTNFEQIETIVGFKLPASARAYPQWWENDPKHVQAYAWLTVGFQTENLSFTAETVDFVRRLPASHDYRTG